MYSYTVPGQVAGKRLRVTRADTLNETLTADLNGSWSYNNEGKLTGVNYPGDPNGNYAPPSYSYSYDGMGRLAGMTETAPTSLTLVSGVTYNAAGQMLTGLDTRTYNSMGQLTSVYGITYNYSAAQNNGKITSQVDNSSGEQVTYAYDSLNRLISAQAGSSWGQGFAYDPFGNLTDKTVLAGSVPTLHVVPDPLTNHMGGEDANGNSGGATWDVENRMIANGTARAAYDAQNKRVWSCTTAASYLWFPCTSETYFFYGPGGKLLAQFTPVYTLAWRDQQYQNHPATFTFQNTANTRAYFGGRMLGAEDRLGSRGKYFPYGDDRSNPPPANDQVKFATYTRDSATGLDYADQRYYAASYGRFVSPDPYQASGGPSDPGSWNRYTYTRGDPINRFDPSGLEDEGPPAMQCVVDGLEFEGGFCEFYWSSTHFAAGNNKKKKVPLTQQQKVDARKTYEQTKQAVLDIVGEALKDPNCRGLFGEKDPYSVLTDVLNGTGTYARFSLTYWQPDDQGYATSGEVIHVSLFGTWFKINAIEWANEAGAGNNVENAETLLHELGHLFSALGFGTDVKNDSAFNNANNGQYNNWLIDQNCFGGVLGYPKP
jgi:RHS repeat-associated protein